MTIRLAHQVYARTNRRRVVERRDFLRLVASTGVASAGMNWADAIRLSAGQLRQRGMACILLWMNGGPSQFETFDPKPEHDNGGETKAIATKVPGVQLADNLPNLAEVADELAIIRSLTSKEGSHPRASYLMHHGYLPMGGVKFPTLGSNVAHQIGDVESELPSFVRIGGRARNAGNAGFLGVDYDPFVLSNPQRPPQNSRPATSRDRYTRRLELLGSLDADFVAVEGSTIVRDHGKLVQRAADMILGPKMDAYDLELESTRDREAYGSTPFAAGCLLSRRLVEAGVTFVEVVSGGWDTHQDNFERHRDLTSQVDQPMARLITDLKDGRVRTNAAH